MKNSMLFFLVLFILCSCTGRSGVQGIDIAYPVESGSIKVMDAQKKDSFTQYDQTMRPRGGNIFVFVTLEVKGVVPLAGVDEGLSNLMNGDWALMDINHKKYPVSGLVGGDLVFEVPDDATGLILALGSSVKVPIGLFFGEEINVEDLDTSASEVTPLPISSNERWAVQVIDAYWNTDAGPAILPGEHERLLAITINLEYIGEESDITEENFIQVTDDKGRNLDFIQTLILNNSEVPDGGKDWIAISDVKESTRHFTTGEKFIELVLFFIGMEDAQGFILNVDDLPPVDLSKILVVQQ